MVEGTKEQKRDCKRGINRRRRRRKRRSERQMIGAVTEERGRK